MLVLHVLLCCATRHSAHCIVASSCRAVWPLLGISYAVTFTMVAAEVPGLAVTFMVVERKGWGRLLSLRTQLLCAAVATGVLALGAWKGVASTVLIIAASLCQYCTLIPAFAVLFAVTPELCVSWCCIYVTRWSHTDAVTRGESQVPGQHSLVSDGCLQHRVVSSSTVHTLSEQVRAIAGSLPSMVGLTTQHAVRWLCGGWCIADISSQM